MKSKTFFRLVRLSLLFSVMIAPPGLAQGAESVKVSVDLVAWGDEIRSLSFDRNVTEGKFTALPFAYSEPVSYTGPPLMAIYQGIDRREREVPLLPGPDGRPGPAPEAPKDAAKPPAEKEAPAKTGLLAELQLRRLKDPRLAALAPIPRGCQRVTVLLAPAGEGIYQAHVIDDDPAKLPPGKVRIHNLSNQLVSVRCNGAKEGTVLKVRETVMADAPGGYLAFELAYQKDGGWEYQENNVVPIRSADQTQMVVLQSDHDFFQSRDGSKSAFLQMVVLRRTPRE